VTTQSLPTLELPPPPQRPDTDHRATRARAARPWARWWNKLADPQTRRGLWALTDQAVVSGTGFATAVLLGRICSQDDLGVYYLALGLVLFVRGIQERLISAPYMVLWSRRDTHRQATYAGSTLVHQMVFSACTLLGFLALMAILWVAGRELIPSSVVWAMLGALPFLLLREYARQFTFAHLRFALAALLDSTVAATQLGALVVLAYLGRLTVGSVYLVMGLGCALACLVWWIASRHHWQFLVTHVALDWRHNWAFGKWILAGQLVQSIVPFLMPWALAWLHGTDATGLLAACATLAGFANVLVTGLGNQLTPEAATAFAARGPAGLRLVLRRSTAVFAATLGTLSLAFLLAGNRLMVLVYGHEFAGAGPILVVLALATFVSSIELVAGNGLWAMELAQANFVADVASLAVSVLAAICMLPFLGALGVALATLTGSAGGATVRLATLRRHLRQAERHTDQGLAQGTRA